jgi:hypothetical protein
VIAVSKANTWTLFFRRDGSAEIVFYLEVLYEEWEPYLDF